MNVEQQYIDLFSQTEAMICKHSAEVLNAPRAAAFADFERLGFPTRKMEKYKYTDISKYFEPDYGLNLNRLQIPVNPYEVFKCDVPNMSTALYFVVNDAFYNKVLPKTHLPEGVIFGSLKEVAAEHPELVKKYYGKLADTSKDGITAFNTAFAQDGVIFYVPKNVIVEKPIQLVNILRADVNEVAEFLDNVESGNKLSKAQLKRHEKLKTRDLALLTLMLGTGIRVSECVGLDMKDVDFDNDRIKVVRKGGAESFVYFGDEVEEALSAYMEERKELNPKEGHENALFLSSVGKRLCVRSVELLVKKYASTVTTVKHITPHKLRSTYGTNLYQESKDIYLVADVLGHKDVNTTRRHYAEIVDENKRNARNIVHLRRD